MFFWILQVLFVVVIAVYLNLPPPELTENLKSWKQEGQYFNFENHKIFYIDVDTMTTGEDTVICLHGFPTSSYDWIEIYEGLNSHFKRVVYLDFLGLGFSDKPYYHEYKVGEQANIVESLLRKLRIKKVHLLSHDYGDSIAQELLARQIQHGKDYDFHYKSLCMLNGGIFPGHYHPLLTQKLLLMPFLNVIIPRIGNFQSFKRTFHVVFGPNTQPTEEDMREFYALMRYNDGNLVLPSILHYLKERDENKQRWEGALQNTKIPVHFIYGPKDPINLTPEFTDYYRETLPKHSIDILEDIGHYPQWESPEKVINCYIKFLKRIK